MKFQHTLNMDAVYCFAMSDMSTTQDQVDELKVQVQKLQELYACLVDPPLQREVSEQAIDTFVEGVLAQNENNSAWVPDSIERAVYKRVTGMCLRAVKEMLASARVDLCGHDLRFTLQPSAAAEKSVENFDLLISALLSKIFSTAHIQVAGHDIQFHFH